MAVRATSKIIIRAICFGRLVISVCGGFGSLSDYVIQVYIVTFKHFFSYFEQCLNSLSLSHTGMHTCTHTPLWEMF